MFLSQEVLQCFFFSLRRALTDLTTGKKNETGCSDDLQTQPTAHFRIISRRSGRVLLNPTLFRSWTLILCLQNVYFVYHFERREMEDRGNGIRLTTLRLPSRSMLSAHAGKPSLLPCPVSITSLISNSLPDLL